MGKKKAVMYLVSFAIVVALIYYVGVGDIVESFSNANPYLLIAAFIPQFIIIILQSERLSILFGRKFKLKELIPIYIYSSTLNKISPVGVAGEPLKAYLVKKAKDLGYEKSLICIFIERAVDFTVVGILLIVSLIPLGLFLNSSLPIVQYATIIAVIFIIALGIIYFKQEILFKTLRWMVRVSRRLLKSKKFSSFDESEINKIPISKRNLLEVFAITFVRWGFAAARTGIVVLAFGQALNAPLVMLIVTLSTLITIIPVLPGGAGLVETVNTTIFSMFGIGVSTAFAIAIFDRIVAFYFYPVLSLGIGAGKLRKKATQLT